MTPYGRESETDVYRRQYGSNINDQPAAAAAGGGEAPATSFHQSFALLLAPLGTKGRLPRR